MQPAATVQTAFLDCPRCGGWARRADDTRRSRWHCRGCRWTGFAGVGA